MIKYNQEIYKKSETTNNAGLLEIAFKDNSRFVGEFVDNAFQGKGALFIQDIGRYEGEYFDNKIIDGLFTLNGWLQYEGTFDNNERFAEGTFTIESLGLNFYIKFVQTRLFICKLYEEDGSEIELLKKPDDIHYIYKNGYHLELSPDLDAIYIYKPYDEDLYDGKRFDIDIKNNVFVQQNYLDGKETGFQKQFSLENIPYYQEYESRSSMDEMPVFKMTSVNGNSYLGRKNFQNGEVRMYNKTYFFSGGVKGSYKHGSGYLEFSDGYRQDVIYIEDKIAYKGLQEVFDFVTNFKALDVEELQIGQNINMIRFMDKVKSFDGKIDDGDTEERFQDDDDDGAR